MFDRCGWEYHFGVCRYSWYHGSRLIPICKRRLAKIVVEEGWTISYYGEATVLSAKEYYGVDSIVATVLVVVVILREPNCSNIHNTIHKSEVHKEFDCLEINGISCILTF